MRGARRLELVLDDGKIRLRIGQCGADSAETTVVNGGTLSDRKRVNVPDAVLPMSAMTEKDRRSPLTEATATSVSGPGRSPLDLDSPPRKG
ncbi:pyruvate kinase [compost metagenome]|jgi:pyruvate kinase